LSPKGENSLLDAVFYDFRQKGETAREDLMQVYTYQRACEIYAMAEQVGKGSDPFLVNIVKLILSYYDARDIPQVNELSNRAKEYLQPLMLQEQLDQNPFKPYPGPEVYGPVALGYAHQGPFQREACPAGLTAEELNQHVLIIGRSGAGKTNLIFFMLQSLMESVPVWVFDFKKDYRYLLHSHGNVLVIDWKDLRFNPLRPPHNVNPKEWLQVFTNTFCEALGLMYGSKTLFREMVDSLYREHGVYSGADKYPSFTELQRALSTVDLKYWKARVRAEYLQRCLGRVDDCITILGDVLDCRRGFPIEQMLDANVVFELHGLADSELQNLLMIQLLSYVFMYRIANDHRGALRHVMVFDEGKRVFDAHREKIPAEGIPTIAILASQVREFGEAMIVSDQMIRMLGESIKSNVATKICMSLADGADLMEMARSMGLNQDQAKHLQSIGVGQSIIRLSARHPNPFILLTPEVTIKKQGIITDDQVRGAMHPIIEKLQSVSEIPTGAGKPQEDVIELTDEVKDKRRESPAKRPRSLPVPREAKGEKPSKKKEEIEVSDDAMIYLEHIRDHPFIGYEQRRKQLGFGGPKAKRIQDELVSKGLARTVEVKTTKKGRATRFFELTDKGEALVGKQDLGGGKGGFEHVYHQHRLKQRLEEQGHKVEIEYNLQGKNADLGIITDEGTIAIEVAMSAKGEFENIIKDLKVGFKRVIVLCKDDSVKNSVEKEAKERFTGNYEENVSIGLLSDHQGLNLPEIMAFLENLPNLIASKIIRGRLLVEGLVGRFLGML